MVEDDASRQRFESLLHDHWKIVLKVANTYARQPDDRNDLMQEISLQLWRAWPKYDESRSFSTWMYRIALNVAISYVRNASTHARHTTDLADADAAPAAVKPQNIIGDELRSLMSFIERSDELNRAILMLYLDDHSYREIAEIMGISETNVATKISRLKQRIREEIS